jgi:sugar phosphate isomerase/epimerase
MPIGITANPFGVPMPQAPALAAAAGYDGLEWSVGGDLDDDPFWDPAVRDAYAAAARDEGLSTPSIILSIAGKIDFPPDGAERARGIRVIREAIQACALTGIPVMMVPCLKQGRETPQDQIDRLVEDIRACAPDAEAAGIVLGIEDMITADQNIDLLRRIDHPAVRLYYDIGNSIRYDLDPYAEVAALGSLICQHHIKDAVANPPIDDTGRPANVPMLLGEGQADFPRFLRAVRDAAFDGWFVMETRPVNDDPVGSATENLTRLRTWLAAIDT